MEFPEGQVPETPQERQQLDQAGYVPCYNARCDFMISPEIEEYVPPGQQFFFTCPRCGHTYDLNSKVGVPGGMGTSGLDPTTAGDVAEQVVQSLGEIPGYGPILWWHKGRSQTPSAMDGAVAEWGVEVKSADAAAANQRANFGVDERQNKAQAASDASLWAQELGDESLIAIVGKMKWHGVLGVLVVLDFQTSTADVFVREMPLSWNLKKGQWHGILNFRSHNATLVAEAVPFTNPLPEPGQAQLPAQDWDDIPAFSKVALDYAGDAYLDSVQDAPTQNIGNDPGSSPELGPQGDIYDFFYGAGQLHVAPQAESSNLRDHALGDERPGPMAEGKVFVTNGSAAWEVSSNVSANALFRILKDYTERAGWIWGGMTAQDGEPISDEFAPKKSMWFFGEYPGGTDMEDRLKNKEDFEQKDIYSPDEARSVMFGDPKDERKPTGTFNCPHCGELFGSWHLYLQHKRENEPMGDWEPHDESGFPDMPTDEPHFHEMRFGAPSPPEGKDLVQAPIPFLYDIDQDDIYIGEAGQRTSDVPIPGEYTPAGIVEGVYEPGGKVVFISMTNMPYSVRHVLDLWKYQHPELQVTGLSMRDAEGKETKLAAQPSVGRYISSLVAADPAAWNATNALRRAGGKAYVVGGAPRDAIMGKEPNDIDMMVTGLHPQIVRKTLEELPGRVDLTGKDFGVFRYKNGHHEVEIALPRSERSTGEGHQDFDVQVDPNMRVEDDLYRRDFTANAMAVDLSTGHLVDPFGGEKDIKEHTLRLVNENALAEDPLRTVRAVVASAKHGLYPDEVTRAQMAQQAHKIDNLPAERIFMELDKLMKSDNPARAIKLSYETGVLKHLLPEVHDAMGYNQNNPHHSLDLGSHMISVLDHTAKQTKDPDVRMAALLHDIGKPASAWVNPVTGFNHYYQFQDPVTGELKGQDHATVGANMAYERLFDNLKYPKDRAQRVHELVNHHMFPAFNSPKGARKFLNRVGDHADDLLILRQADQGGKAQYPTDPTKSVDQQRLLVDQVRNAGAPTTQASLAINGHDLINLGIQPGPQLGQILNSLTEAVVEDPALNTPETLLELAQSYA